MRFRAVVFDLWNTLVPWDTAGAEPMYVRMGALVGVDGPAFSDAWGATTNARWTTPLAAGIEEVCRALAVEKADVEALGRLRLEGTRALFRPRDDAVPTLRELRSRGHSIGLVSNCGGDIPELWSQTPLAPYVDAPVFSCSVAAVKPEARIYQAVCERLAVDAQECLYVGDGGDDELAGAERVGMTAVQLRADGGEPPTSSARAWQGRAIGSLSEVLELV